MLLAETCQVVAPLLVGIEEGALAPLHHRFRIKIVAAGESRRRRAARAANSLRINEERQTWGFGRGILLWLLGIPIPIIILLALFWHH
jgi:hypothetical protein